MESARPARTAGDGRGGCGRSVRRPLPPGLHSLLEQQRRDWRSGSSDERCSVLVCDKMEAAHSDVDILCAHGGRRCLPLRIQPALVGRGWPV